MTQVVLMPSSFSEEEASNIWCQFLKVSVWMWLGDCTCQTFQPIWRLLQMDLGVTHGLFHQMMCAAVSRDMHLTQAFLRPQDFPLHVSVSLEVFFEGFKSAIPVRCHWWYSLSAL